MPDLYQNTLTLGQTKLQYVKYTKWIYVAKGIAKCMTKKWI